MDSYHDHNRQSPTRVPAGVLAALACALLVAGCSVKTESPVDAPRAQEALKTVLDGWKDGKDPSSFASASPAITVQDMDWIAGAKLVGYQVAGDGRKAESSLFVPVKLTLRT